MTDDNEQLGEELEQLREQQRIKDKNTKWMKKLKDYNEQQRGENEKLIEQQRIEFEKYKKMYKKLREDHEQVCVHVCGEKT